jgi:hypothetical protein
LRTTWRQAFYPQPTKDRMMFPLNNNRYMAFRPMRIFCRSPGSIKDLLARSPAGPAELGVKVSPKA